MRRRPHFLRPLFGEDGGSYELRTRGGSVLATTVETAFDSAARRRGLLGRDGLPAGTALVIAPCSLVHTFSMRFAIDVIFVARDGRVLKIRRAVPARRLAGAWQAFATVEMAAGSVERAGVAVGDYLVVESADSSVTR
jgi:uncharacterized membrane protein (UPF0127 family)